MKELKKKSLDELEKVMPVISKTEQATYVGGTIYFDESGAFIKQVGNSNEIKWVANADQHKLSNISGDVPNDLGSPIAGSTRAIMYGVVRHYAGNFGFNNVQFSPDMINEAGVDKKTLELYINSNSEILNNKDSLLCTLRHEQWHRDNDTTGSYSSEIKAIEEQIKYPNYAATPRSYKKLTANYLFEQWDRAGLTYKSGYTMQDAERICGYY